MVSSYCCRAPEVHLQQPYDHRSDLWSLGCILFELCALEHAFGGMSLAQVSENVCSGRSRPVWTDTVAQRYSAELRGLCNCLLSVRASARPSAATILASDFVQLSLRRVCEKYGTRPDGTPNTALAHLWAAIVHDPLATARVETPRVPRDDGRRPPSASPRGYQSSTVTTPRTDRERPDSPRSNTPQNHSRPIPPVLPTPTMTSTGGDKTSASSLSSSLGGGGLIQVQQRPPELDTNTNNGMMVARPLTTSTTSEHVADTISPHASIGTTTFGATAALSSSFWDTTSAGTGDGTTLPPTPVVVSRVVSRRKYVNGVLVEETKEEVATIPPQTCVQPSQKRRKSTRSSRVNDSLSSDLIQKDATRTTLSGQEETGTLPTLDCIERVLLLQLRVLQDPLSPRALDELDSVLTVCPSCRKPFASHERLIPATASSRKTSGKRMTTTILAVEPSPANSVIDDTSRQKDSRSSLVRIRDPAMDNLFVETPRTFDEHALAPRGMYNRPSLDHRLQKWKL